jgi:hypothetical protein
MKGLSYKYKIYALLAAIVAASLIFFVFIYGWMNQRNQAMADSTAAKNQEYAEAVAEQHSYELGKQDLITLQSKSLQPDDLFSQDTKVVKEIKTLETLAHALGIEFTLQVSGTAKTAPKLAKATGQIHVVPYTIVLEGDFEKIVNFIETAEHLNFVTQTKAFTITALDSGATRAALSSEFYIKP